MTQIGSDEDRQRQRNYDVEQWWVAAFSDELVHDRPLARRLLDQPVVLCRCGDGLPDALLDRCPHRQPCPHRHRGRIKIKPA